MSLTDLLPDASSLLPDFNDPNSMAKFGALAGLAQSATPQYGVRKINANSALLGIIGNMMGGAVGGAQGAQGFQQRDIANQIGQLGLQKQQVLQPLQMAMMKNAMGGGAPGSLTGQPSANGGSSSPMDVADQQFAQAYQLAMASGDMAKASAVLQSWAEHNPGLAGAIEGAKAQNSVNQTPNGPIFGTAGIPGAGASAPFGSIAPPTSGAPPQGTQPPITPVQGPTQIPPVNASALQPPPAPGQIPNNPFAQSSTVAPFNPMSKVSTEAAAKSATDNAEAAAEAAKTYNVMTSNFPNMMQRVKDMSDANKISSFGPLNDAGGNGLVTSFHDAMNDPTSVANVALQQRAAQGVLPELGPSLAQAGIKGNKFLETLANQSTNVDLAKGRDARQTQIDGLMKAYIQNMKSAHDQIGGLGGNPSPLPAPVVAQAVKYGVMSRPEAEKYLQQNHNMQ